MLVGFSMSVLLSSAMWVGSSMYVLVSGEYISLCFFCSFVNGSVLVGFSVSVLSVFVGNLVYFSPCWLGPQCQCW